MAAGDLVTLQQVKDWLSITDSSKDAMLTTLISAASKAIQNYIGRDLTYSTLIDEWRDGGHRDRMMLLRAPVDTVTSVEVDGIVIPAATSVTGVGWRSRDDSVILVGHTFSRGKGNVRIVYSGGYQTIPADLQQAALLTVSAFYTSKGVDQNLSSEAVPGVWSGSYGGTGNSSGVGSIPGAARSLIDLGGYRRFVWGSFP